MLVHRLTRPLILLSTLLVFSLTGCEMLQMLFDEEGDEEISSGTMTVTIDGETCTDTEMVRAFYDGAGNINIGGGKDGWYIQLLLSEYVEPGDYEIVEFSSTTATARKEQESRIGESGTITIESCDENGAEGTFAFTAYPGFGNAGENYEITDGSFSITYWQPRE